LVGVDPVADEVLHAELIDQVRFTGHAEYTFRHPLIRTVAYESQLKSDRAALHRKLANAIESRETSADENAALIAEHLEAAGNMRAAYGWHMRAGGWSHARDIGAALASWDRAARLADQLPAEDADQLAMRIAPRTMSCANGWRIHEPIAGKRFQQLEDLCTAAGDKASTAIATLGLVGEHFMKGRLHEVSRLASEYMAFIESIGDPALTVGLAIGPMASKNLTGEMAEVLGWTDRIIDLAEGDRATGDYVVGSPLASAYAMRSTARWWLGQAGWRDDFNTAVSMARDADPISQAVIMTYTYSNAIASGVIAPDDAALHDIDEALRNAERTADDVALGLGLSTKATALWKSGFAQRDRAFDLFRQAQEMAMDGRIYVWLAPVIDLRLAEEMTRRGDRSALPRLHAGVDAVYSSGLLGYGPWATDILVEALVKFGTENDLHEAESALERMAAQPVLDGSTQRDLIVLKGRALLARARGDELTCRDFADRYRDMATSLGFVGHMAMAVTLVGADGIEPPTAGV
jgi:adenylate cyclase